MTEPNTSAPEALKVEDWAGEMGEKWLANLDRFEGMIAPIGQALLARAAYRPGERVLDIGCGGGATTLAIGRAVAPGGVALGLDIAPGLIARASQRAADAEAGNVAFRCADAATAEPEGEFYDRLFSRFGSMFFANPHAAFANLRRWLKPGARIDLAVWAPPRANPWMMGMMSTVRQHIEVPPAVPRAPGPFAFEDLDYLAEILGAGGFADMAVDAWEGALPLGGAGATPEDTLAFIRSAMAVGRLLEEQDEPVRHRVEADLLGLFETHHRPGEGVLMGAKAWLVSAKAA